MKISPGKSARLAGAFGIDKFGRAVDTIIKELGD